MIFYMKNKAAGKFGFSLIELLVVVVIIAILVAMILPAINRARGRAKELYCATQLRQIAIAWEMYLMENSDTFPSWRANIQWFYGGKHPSIYSANALSYRPLNPYMAMAIEDENDAEIFRCPADRQIYDGEGGIGPSKGYDTYDYYGNSYMMNWTLTYRTIKGSYTLGQIEASHSRLILAGDCQWYYTVNNAVWDANFHNYNDWMNMLFVDGHSTFFHLIRGKGSTGDYTFDPLDRTEEDEE